MIGKTRLGLKDRSEAEQSRTKDLQDSIEDGRTFHTLML
jgi:hypothetical protein